MIVTKSPFATSREIRRSTKSRPSAWGNDFSRFERLIMGAGYWVSGARYLRPDAKASEPSPVAADTRHQGPDTYSFLNATIGSIRAALRAGPNVARNANASTATATTAYTRQSVVVTPNRIARSDRETSVATMAPE